MATVKLVDENCPDPTVQRVFADIKETLGEEEHAAFVVTRRNEWETFRGYERSDFEEAVWLLSEGKVPADLLITDVLPLSSTPEAFAALEAGRAMKILIDCGGERS